MREDIQKVVGESLEAIKKSYGLTSIPAEIEIDIPKKGEFGDFSTNVALILANKLKRKPREVAELIVSNISQEGGSLFKKIEIAGPGFINFFLKEEEVANRLVEIQKQGSGFGSSDLGKGEKVLVEFVSANPTGYLHIGHARNAAVGDAIANILTAVGYDVTKEFYINDAGRQMDLLGISVYRRYEELFGIEKGIPEDGYRGEYVKEIALEIKEKKGGELIADGFDEQRAVDYCREYAKDILLEDIRNDLREFGVTFNEWYSEREKLYRPTQELGGDNRINIIKDKLGERGALEENEGALWFRATKFGDTQDWVLVKRDGSPTYFLSDIAYHYDKIERGFKRLINIWGADHHGHVERLRAALRALELPDSCLQVVLIQFVRLMREGVEVSMSKRAGSFVSMREVMEEVGSDVMRFFLLMRSSDAHLDFDLDLAKKESSENPVYYIQYAYARIGSVFQKAKERELLPSEEFLNLLSLPEEVQIIKKLLLFPEVVRDSAVSLAPHKIVFYLQDIASDFHVYYNKNRIVGEDAGLSQARLYFVNCVRRVIGNGLKLLGISAPERM
ncbi:MAG TPA: arginine--tRNA ligase [Thermodesulfobacteriota bacterium]|nr:arginine--tRNA ligase [Thermodesulfobacteriota bacterium]